MAHIFALNTRWYRHERPLIRHFNVWHFYSANRRCQVIPSFLLTDVLKEHCGCSYSNSLIYHSQQQQQHPNPAYAETNIPLSKCVNQIPL